MRTGALEMTVSEDAEKKILEALAEINTKLDVIRKALSGREEPDQLQIPNLEQLVGDTNEVLRLGAKLA